MLHRVVKNRAARVYVPQASSRNSPVLRNKRHPGQKRPRAIFGKRPDQCERIPAHAAKPVEKKCAAAAAASHPCDLWSPSAVQIPSRDVVSQLARSCDYDGKHSYGVCPGRLPGLDRGIPSGVCVEAARFSRVTVRPIMTNCSID
jgi:hypothetical protein